VPPKENSCQFEPAPEFEAKQNRSKEKIDFFEHKNTAAARVVSACLAHLVTRSFKSSTWTTLLVGSRSQITWTLGGRLVFGTLQNNYLLLFLF
jgi:hypothetical protein